jgi:hypothetical protein
MNTLLYISYYYSISRLSVSSLILKVQSDRLNSLLYISYYSINLYRVLS